MANWKKIAFADSAQTFSGDQTFSGNIEILKSSPLLRVKDSSNDVRGFLTVSSGVVKMGGSDNNNVEIQSNGTTRITIKSAGDVSFTGWIEGNGENALYSNTSTGLLIQAPDTTEEIHFRDKNGSVGMLYNAGNKRLGVGTDSPDYPLHVHGSSDGIGYVKISDSNTGEGDTDGARIGFNSGVMRIQNFENSDMEFYVNNTTKPLILESDGNATFAGGITLEGGHTITNSSGDLTLESAGDDINIKG